MNITRALGQMSPGRAILFGCALAGIYYFLMYDGGTSIIQNIATRKESIDKVKLELATAKQKLERAQVFEQTSKQLGQTLHSVLSYVPENTNNSDLMKIVSNEVKTSGARLLKMRGIEEPESTSFYQAISVEVELQGSFVQHMLFLSNLTRLDQILTVDRLNMESTGELMDSDSPWTTMRVTVKGYRYIPPKEDANAATS